MKELELYASTGKLSKGTIKNYNTTSTHLNYFIKNVKKQNDIPMGEIEYSFINEFDIYLKTTYRSKEGKSICNNHANKQHSRLRTVLHKATRETRIGSNPYSQFRLKAEKSKREFLSEQELKLLSTNSLQGNQSLLKVRDYFLFSCYTGLRFVDASQLKMTDLIHEQDGATAIQIIMEKTKEEVYIPILNLALQIIEKYSNDEARKVFDLVLPQFSNQKINAYLKTIADPCGISKELTHHVARHTCATLLLNRGMPLEVVQRILGHNDIRTTKIYARMLNGTVKEEMKKIGKQLNSNT